MKLTYEEKVKRANDKGIVFEEDIIGNRIVGIYGFFACKANEMEKCFYVGKTTCMETRMLNSTGGHIHNYLNNVDCLVSNKIKEYQKLGYTIYVRILEKVDYDDTYFSRAAHRLALAELRHIVKYQEEDCCLDQLPEGIGQYEENYWKENYKKD